MLITVLLADDHPIVREGFKALLEREGVQVVGEASDGREAVRLARTLHPDVAVLDLSMPLLNGLQAAQAILHASPRTRTILLTMYSEDHYVLEAMRAGIRGYVVKRQAVMALVQAVQVVAEGKTTKEIARLLGISTKTAETPRDHIMKKLDIHETASLVRYAIRRGVIQP